MGFWYAGERGAEYVKDDSDYARERSEAEAASNEALLQQYPGLTFFSQPADTGYDTTPGGRYYSVDTPDYAKWWSDPSISSPEKTWENWLGNTSGTFEYTGDIMNLFGGGRTGAQQTGWNARDASAMQDYLERVSGAIGEPEYDWLPYLQQAQTEHQGAFGIPWVSDRSNPYAAVNAVLAKAGLSRFDIPPDVVAKMTDIIQQTQGAMGSQWLDGPGPMMLLAVLTAGLAAPAAAGAGAAEAGGAAAAGAAGAAATIPELGLIATPALADAALAAGIPAATLSGGAGALGLPGGMFSGIGDAIGQGVQDLRGLLSGNPLAEFGVPDWATSIGKNFAKGMLTGQDPKRAAIGAVLPQGIQFAGEMLPSLGDLPSFLGGSGVDEVGLSAYDLDETFADVPPADSDPLKRRLSLASEGTLAPADMSGFSQPLMPPAVPEVDPTFGGQLAQTAPGVYEQPAVGMLGSTLMPPAQPEPDPTFEGQLAETAPGVFEQPPAEPVPTVPRISDADAKRYASIAQKVYGLFEGGEDQVRQGAPRRSQREDGTEESFEEMTPEETEEYFDQVVEYLGLDTAAMAEAGLTPGTPEYLDYILQQIDAMIAQGFGDADPDSEDFSALLRTKTEQEVQSLARALYIRGQLGIFAGPGSYMDPFTEIMEDVAAPEGASFRPSVAAYHRGLARSAEEMSKLAPQERKRFLGGMLDREPDLFGAQAKRDAQALREALSQTPEDEMKKRRKGMFGEEAYFQSELERMGKPDLDRMLRLLMGQDTARQGAAVEELFGWNPEMI